MVRPNVAAVEYCIRNAGSAASVVVISTGGDTLIEPDTATLISVFPEQSICDVALLSIKLPLRLPISLALILLIRFFVNCIRIYSKSKNKNLL
ncbi:hypothetical protein D5b_00446 [Faustovirus]|nr:hypothetical protein D5b_00446 [Faustovirus]AMN84473.1 hypothetical protein D6_00062 [Faustovirus]AMP44385.1 hypothetical protein PRJ_Dakar_00434 [Faustovirus]